MGAAVAARAAQRARPERARVSAILKRGEALRALAFSFPGAYEDSPWGESVAKVGKKVFVFMGMPTATSFGFSVKLPDSADQALSFDWVEPTGYGLGKAGWVSVSLARGVKAPAGLLEDWIEESYRTIAPKKLIAELDGRAPRR
jgi:predicted DNA-binding protein (MmcQ/YjbR family)